MKVDKLVKNVYETIMASGMICQGDSVVVGVSGGGGFCLPAVCVEKPADVHGTSIDGCPYSSWPAGRGSGS